MDPNYAVELARATLFAALAVAAPLLAAVLVVALGLAILQTVLNLQEQTLTVIPKVVVAVTMTALLAPWMLRTLLDFAVPILRDVLAQGGAQ